MEQFNLEELLQMDAIEMDQMWYNNKV